MTFLVVSEYATAVPGSIAELDAPFVPTLVGRTAKTNLLSSAAPAPRGFFNEMRSWISFVPSSAALALKPVKTIWFEEMVPLARCVATMPDNWTRARFWF